MMKLLLAILSICVKKVRKEKRGASVFKIPHELTVKLLAMN